MKEWKQIEWGDECPRCGHGVEVLTECLEHGMAYDGDKARCGECGFEGWVSERGDEFSAIIIWNEEK